MRLFARFAAAWLVVTFATVSLAQDSKEKKEPLPSTEKPKADQPFKRPETEFNCRFTEQKIEIDGLGTDSAWETADVIDAFHLPWLGAKARGSKTATKARLLWDRDYLYFLAEMEDHDLYADVKDKDGMLWNNDVFELFFKPAEDKPGYYEFQVNAAGATLDMFLPRRGTGGYARYKDDGKFDFPAKVKLKGSLNRWTDKDEGWSVEGRLAWGDFLRTGGRPEVNEIWKFALCRYDYTVEFEGPELSTIAPLKQANFHAHENYASLKFLGPQQEPAGKKLGIDPAKFKPLTTSKVVGSPDPPLPYRAVKAYPKLPMTFPIGAKLIPGSDTMLVIAQNRSSGPSVINRFRDSAETTELIEYLPVPGTGTAYGMAFHPKFAENGYMYLGWNGSIDKSKKMCRVTRFKLDPKPPHAIDPASALEIIAWESDGHNGADVTFGNDGFLYVTSGDGTSDSDTNIAGQTTDTLLSKVLRIDVDHPEGDKQYSIPKDNPFVQRQEFRPETYAYGLRNPWRITTDPVTGHIWVGNNGQDLWEQVYFVRPGDNYGWSVYEGGNIFYAERKLGPDPHVKPTAEHHHNEARSLTGGVVYHGSKYPELKGAYIYGDHSTGRIWAIKHDGQKVVWHKLIADTTYNISGFALDSKGELLVLDHRSNGEGGMYHLEPIPAETVQQNFPRKLSESGLFQDVAKHSMVDGVVPYSVNSPLWSDGSHKERFIAIPAIEGRDMKIEFNTGRSWKFPDDAVLVKSFALETTAGDPKSRRWVETRFMVKQEGEWAGYSYRWNEAQTDAELVEAGGADQTFEIRVPKSSESPASVRQQKWHYPSRTECMVCHSRAANFVLGLSESQMNREHDYGGVVDHQFRVLERLGMLKIAAANEPTVRFREQLKTAGLADKDINDHFRKAADSDMQRAGKTTQSLFVKDVDAYKKLPNPYDETETLDARARSYLQSNCSHCHIDAGGGNSQMQLEFNTDPFKMKLIGEKPLHHKFDLKDPLLVAPGEPDRSVLLHRLANRGEKSGQMPQLATYLVDEAAVKLFRAWIAEVKQPEPPKVEPPKTVPAKVEAPKAEPAKPESVKPELPKAAPAK
ncbi:Soluble aldose sugar dehydrogenase YliI precursor [Anatilimnocola aggregata]|uniref:Soluble aldose sugar dehydrogenase YliI n=2 Tax=Anatilimnocola aggregata TaxID=2528021 RepID=A0A517YEW9_9BACT|nr:Soluble aldose sugar dehydrogenase YliI precursor [Anatilimnocola aggregata]